MNLTVTDVMLDLETMGTNLDSPIVAIGAVGFNQFEIFDEFYMVVDMQSCFDLGFVPTGDTIRFWLQQKEEARRERYLDKGVHLSDALLKFANWLSLDRSNYRMWGDGAAFDNAMLRYAYKICGLTLPWRRWNDRCYQTKKADYPEIEAEYQGVYHKAIDDARNQAAHLIKIWEHENALRYKQMDGGLE